MRFRSNSADNYMGVNCPLIILSSPFDDKVALQDARNFERIPLRVSGVENKYKRYSLALLKCSVIATCT